MSLRRSIRWWRDWKRSTEVDGFEGSLVGLGRVKVWIQEAGSGSGRRRSGRDVSNGSRTNKGAETGG